MEGTCLRGLPTLDRALWLGGQEPGSALRSFSATWLLGSRCAQRKASNVRASCAMATTVTVPPVQSRTAPCETRITVCSGMQALVYCQSSSLQILYLQIHLLKFITSKSTLTMFLWSFVDMLGVSKTRVPDVHNAN